MAYCTLCSVAQPGYFVEFNSEITRGYVESILSSFDTDTWRIDDNDGLWVSAHVVTKYVDYWSAHLNPSEWRFQAADRLPTGEYALGDWLDWAAVRDQLPEFWIDRIIGTDSIRMMYQPIVDVSDGVRVIAYEMLARAIDEDGRVISPAQLFDQARSQERLFALDRACRIKAVESGANTPADTLIFANFIPTSVYNPEHCLRTTMAAMRRVGVDPGRVVFEVVETDRVADVAHLKRIFDYYKRQGVQCALDDVGAGFNDVSMLEALSPNVIKLDRSIADGVAGSAEQQDQAFHILHAACLVGARALAEGIERIEDALMLREIGYEWQQGYFYGRPSFDIHPAQVTKLDFRQAA